MKCHDPQTFANPECLTCWAGTFGAWVTANRRNAARVDTILIGLIAEGLDPDVAEHIRQGWEPDFFEILDGLPAQHITALNHAMAVDWWSADDARRAREQDGIDDSGDRR